MHYIFRKTDSVLLYSASNMAQLSNELAACLANEGGQLDDYTIVKDDATIIPAGMLPILVDGSLIRYGISPGRIERARVQDSLALKLKESGLLLTPQELSLLTK